MTKSYFDPYAILQVAENAEPEVVKSAYKALARKYHPDKNGHRKSECELRMSELNRAWGLLSDPGDRTIFDKDRRNAATEGRRDADFQELTSELDAERKRRSAAEAASQQAREEVARASLRMTQAETRAELEYKRRIAVENSLRELRDRYETEVQRRVKAEAESLAWAAVARLRQEAISAMPQGPAADPRNSTSSIKDSSDARRYICSRCGRPLNSLEHDCSVCGPGALKLDTVNPAATPLPKRTPISVSAQTCLGHYKCSHCGRPLASKSDECAVCGTTAWPVRSW